MRPRNTGKKGEERCSREKLSSDSRGGDVVFNRTIVGSRREIKKGLGRKSYRKYPDKNTKSKGKRGEADPCL